MATVAPVLVFVIAYSERKENPITSVFVAPSNTRNPFWLHLLIMFPIIAACPDPRPGRKLQRGEAIVAPRRGFNSFIFGFNISCFGINGFVFIERIKFEAPNNPVNKGKRGWDIFRLSTKYPRKPVSKKIDNAENFFFSREINIIETIIKRYGINPLIRLLIFERRSIDGNAMIIKISIAAKLP